MALSDLLSLVSLNSKLGERDYQNSIIDYETDSCLNMLFISAMTTYPCSPPHPLVLDASKTFSLYLIFGSFAVMGFLFPPVVVHGISWICGSITSVLENSCWLFLQPLLLSRLFSVWEKVTCMLVF